MATIVTTPSIKLATSLLRTHQQLHAERIRLKMQIDDIDDALDKTCRALVSLPAGAETMALQNLRTQAVRQYVRKARAAGDDVYYNTSGPNSLEDEAQQYARALWPAAFEPVGITSDPCVVDTMDIRDWDAMLDERAQEVGERAATLQHMRNMLRQAQLAAATPAAIAEEERMAAERGDTP